MYELLKKNNDIVIGDKQTGPSEDIFDCSIKGKSFTLIYDIDYGTSIMSNDSETTQTLISYFNN